MPDPVPVTPVTPSTNANANANANTTLNRLHVIDQRDVKVVSFIENKILDEANISEIGQGLISLVEARQRPKILLDFKNVDHLSSAALGMLINVNQKVKNQSGELRLVNIKPQIYEVFVITKLNKLFRILPNREEGLASFSQAAS
jgi:anti-sigma B factor antagonist